MIKKSGGVENHQLRKIWNLQLFWIQSGPLKSATGLIVGKTVKFVGRGGDGFAVMSRNPDIVSEIHRPDSCPENTTFNEQATG